MEAVLTTLKPKFQLILGALPTNFYFNNQCPVSPVLLKPHASATDTLHCSLAGDKWDTKIKLWGADLNRLVNWL